ncbi:hypothetical protein C8R44DRAFT_860430 [Mycena epipterygia]|nr:hypothetical protein C8R44DRAFT_860430 [Mycena epipterygia]
MWEVKRTPGGTSKSIQQKVPGSIPGRDPFVSSTLAPVSFLACTYWCVDCPGVGREDPQLFRLGSNESEAHIFHDVQAEGTTWWHKRIAPALEEGGTRGNTWWHKTYVLSAVRNTQSDLDPTAAWFQISSLHVGSNINEASGGTRKFLQKATKRGQTDLDPCSLVPDFQLACWFKYQYQCNLDSGTSFMPIYLLMWEVEGTPGGTRVEGTPGGTSRRPRFDSGSGDEHS